MAASSNRSSSVGIAAWRRYSLKIGVRFKPGLGVEECRHVRGHDGLIFEVLIVVVQQLEPHRVIVDHAAQRY